MFFPDDLYQEMVGKSQPHAVLALMDHIANGHKNYWFVYAWSNSPSPASWRFDDYQEASRKFDELPDEAQPSLVLATRIGTSVCFRLKGVVLPQSDQSTD